MNSKQKGSLVEAAAVSRFYKMGYEVLIPFGNRRPYDLVVDNGVKLLKVQCKFAGFSSRDGHVAHLTVCGGNQSFNTRRKYEKEDFDLLYIYTQDNREFLLNWPEVECASYLRVDASKYDKYKIN